MAKNTFYIMNRRGVFKAPKATSNQCAKPAHPEYNYHVKLMFEGDQPLDNRQFLLDHQEVDDFIRKLGLVGSCEEMHQILKEELPDFMAEKSLKFVCYKATISAGKAQGPAWLEYIWARNERDLKCLSYL